MRNLTNKRQFYVVLLGICTIVVIDEIYKMTLPLGKPEVIIKQRNADSSNSAVGTERNGNNEEKEDSTISVAKNSATARIKTVFDSEVTITDEYPGDDRDEHPSEEKILDHDTKIMMVVMGQKEKFPDWLKILSAINNITLSFIYGSFDEAISTDECDSHKLHADRNFDCSTLYIPNTTWTEGRNMLAGEVLKREKSDNDEDAEKGEVYDWWVFADDDLVPSCAEETYSMEALFGKGGEGESCWQKVFNFIKNDQNNIPEKVTTLAMPSWRIPARKGYIGTSQVDALFAAFKRTYVPYLLPYATVEDGVSQWLSQSANVCIMETCLKQTALLIPFIAGSNNAHREYPRGGFTAENFHKMMSNNFYNDTVSFYPCQEYWPKKQYADMTVVYNTKEELNEGIPDHKLSECDSLTHRFRAWKEEVMKDIL
jgi:hypothetical protein